MWLRWFAGFVAPEKEVLVMGGGERPPDHLRERAEQMQILALDGGTHWVLRWGLVPDLILGDLDSLDGRSRAYADRYGAPIERLASVVGRSDLSQVVDRLEKAHPPRVVFTGCVGTRLDHVMGLYQAMARLALAGIPVEMAERWGAAQVVTSKTPVVWEQLAGERVSLFPLSPRISGIRLTGFDEVQVPDPLEPPCDALVGVPIVSDPAEASVQEGALLMIVARREDPDAGTKGSAGGTPTFRLGTHERTE